MNKFMFVFPVLVAVIWLVFGARARGAVLTPDEIKAVLEECVDRQQRAPGIVIGFIDDKGARVFARGVKTKGKPGAVDGDTIFEIGSVTKAFTGVLLQEMVGRGEVKLGDPIAKYLPKDVKVPARGAKEITLLHLATQRSGLPRLPDNFQIKNAANPYADYTVAQLYQFLSVHKLVRDPDAKYEYSNLGMGLLGHLLALKAGTSYEAAVSNRICAPLLMRDTRITLSPELIARLASGHNQAGIPVSNWDIPALAGAGALRSSANDMLKFLAANLALTNTPLNDVLKQSHAARASAGGGQRIGLGWHINPNGIVWHNGATGGYHSFLGFHPDQRCGVIVLANSENDIDDLGLHILGLMPKLAKVKAPKQRAVANIDTSVYDYYVGRYQLAPAVFFTITREGDHLLAQLTGQGPCEVFPESATEFFYTVVDAQLTFAKDSAGKVTHLILHQNGRDQKAVKVP